MYFSVFNDCNFFHHFSLFSTLHYAYCSANKLQFELKTNDWSRWINVKLSSVQWNTKREESWIVITQNAKLIKTSYNSYWHKSFSYSFKMWYLWQIAMCRIFASYLNSVFFGERNVRWYGNMISLQLNTHRRFWNVSFHMMWRTWHLDFY
jgi:hypothetical protein